MTSEACLRHIESFAAAAMRLCLAAWDDGGDGVLRDVQVSLCEDLKSVMVLATHKKGSDLYACFELPTATTEDDFDSAYWLSIFDSSSDPEAGGDDECCCCWNRTGGGASNEKSRN